MAELGLRLFFTPDISEDGTRLDLNKLFDICRTICDAHRKEWFEKSCESAEALIEKHPGLEREYGYMVESGETAYAVGHSLGFAQSFSLPFRLFQKMFAEGEPLDYICSIFDISSKNLYAYISAHELTTDRDGRRYRDSVQYAPTTDNRKRIQ